MENRTRNRTRRRRAEPTESATPGLVAQAEDHAAQPVVQKPEYDGNLDMITSTGCTLLDLIISGELIRGGGIPSGILVEIYGKNSTGKTVLLCEIAGNVQRKKGQAMFKDPEFRLNKAFSKRFGFEPELADYSNPNTVPEVFKPIRTWKPKNPDVVNGIFTDSLAALSTDLELSKEEGDKMGMRRAKEFSQECRKVCRIIADKNYLMVCSNQMRATGNKFGPSEASTGGNAIPYYASLRLGIRIEEHLTREIEYDTGTRTKKTKTQESKPVTGTIEGGYGIKTEVYVAKSSVAIPYRKAPVYIIFQYGIDDIRGNLVWYKQTTKSTGYFAGGRGLEEAIQIVEKRGLVKDLRESVIDLWERLDQLITQKDRERLPKERW